MKKYTDEQLEQNYNKFIDALKKTFSGDRLDSLLHMYSMDELGPNLMLSPASGNKHFHNAYEGGYIDHIMNVARNSYKVMKLYKESGGVIDFTQEELLFSAFHHDLGKLGEKDKLNYIKNDSQWHIENRGEYYKRNPDLTYMSITDRTFYSLAKYKVDVSENEWFGIKLTDGIYDKDNEKYYITYDTTKLLKSNIQYILHWADHISTTIERDEAIKSTK